MTIIGVKQWLILILAILKGHNMVPLDWTNIYNIVGDSYQNSYGIREVDSTEELNVFMDTVSGYLYFSNSGSQTYQYVQNVEKIVISQHSKLNTIPTKVFEKLANLADFSAVDVSLEEINRDDFVSAENLYYLLLSSNKIQRLDNMVFMHCKKLIEIDLSSNEISYIHDNAFEGMSSSFIQIDLSNNKIKSLKEDSLILLLENIPSTEEDVKVIFTNNQIEEVQPSDRTRTKKLPLIHLALQGNKLKAFECASIKYAFLDLENNEIKSLNAKTSFLQLDVGNNKLMEMFIKETTTSVKAPNNQLTNLTIDSGSQLDTLVLSGNKLGNEVLIQLKSLKLLQTLELSETHLTALNVDTFADLASLEIVRLDLNNILSIGHGVFAHQANLSNLNISYNALNSIDLNVFGALSSLEHIDISGNNISSIKDYESFRQVLPNLSTIGLEANSWNCAYLSKMKNSLKLQNISIDLPRNPVKNKSNFAGIECSENSELIAVLEANSDDALVVKMNSIIEKVNDQNLKIDEIGSKNTQELAALKFSILQLQRDVLGLKSTSLVSQISNSTNINEVRSLVEQMNNVTLEKQKLAIDQLLHEINKQNVEISKFKIDTEKLFMNKIEESLRSEIITAPKTPVSNNSFTRLEILLIIFFLITITLLIIFSVHKTKKYVNSKLDEIARQRVSRRNSISTIVTYEHSNSA